MRKSLFASFSSEKEDFLLIFAHPTPIRVAPATLLAAAVLAGCAEREPPENPRVPPFVAQSWVPLRREAVAAIALREWRLFGSLVDDDPPGSHPQAAAKPERAEGLWQRVGEYWWEAMPLDDADAGATGIHDPQGHVVADDTNTPWSAAFVSYVFRIAGAGGAFPYSASHSTYINAAARGTNALLRAWPPTAYAPRQGDLICQTRGSALALHFADLPTAAPFTSHCDIVVAAGPGQVSVVGGNVDDAVTLKHIPTDRNGVIADPRYAWLAVLQVNYPPQPVAARVSER